MGGFKGQKMNRLIKNIIHRFVINAAFLQPILKKSLENIKKLDDLNVELRDKKHIY